MMDLINEIDQIKIYLEPSKVKDEYTVKLDNGTIQKYAMSKYRPRQEAIKNINFDNVDKETLWIIIGYCMGYTLEHIIEKCGDRVKIIVIEPNETFLKQQLDLTIPHIQESIKRARVTNDINIAYYTMSTVKEVKNQIKKILPGTSVKVVVNPVYLEFYPHFIECTMGYIKEGNRENLLNTNTLAIIAHKLIANSVRNRKHIATSYDIRAYKDLYKDIPAVIVSAGPSLTKNIHLIKDFKGVIFSGGRTVDNVIKQGIKPHFLVSIDSDIAAAKVLRESSENDIPVIAPIVTHYDVLEGNTGPKFMLDNNFPALADGIYNEILPKALYGPSVATLCLERAHYMGCNPIIFIGQDLAYTNNQYHATISSIAATEEDNFIDTKEKTLEKVPGYYEDVYTDALLKMFLNWIESFIEHQQGITYINATEGGAKIEGAKQLTFEECIRLYNKEYSIPQNYKPLMDKNEQDLERALHVTLETLKNGVKTLRKAKQLCNSLEEEYSVYRGTRTNKINALLKQLDQEVDDRLRDIIKIVKSIFNVIAVDIERSGKYKESLDETLIQKGIRIARKGYAIYDSYEKSVKQMIEIIEQNMV